LQKLINKPTDHYSSKWLDYWKQNPSLHRGVGAEATAEETAAAAAAAAKENETPAIDPKAFEDMKAELDRYKIKHQESEKHLKEKEKLARTAAEEAAKKSGDVEALEKSWQDKLTAREAELTGQLTGYEKMVSDMTAGAQALKLAAEMSIPGSADAMLPHIKSRLTTEIHEGKPVLRVLDADGKPSALSIDDLRKEFENNKAFAPLLIGSHASGGGAVNNGKEGGGATINRQAFNALSPGAQMEHIKKGGKLID